MAFLNGLYLRTPVVYVRYVLLYAGKLLQHFRAFETKETLAHDEMLQTDRRGSRMLAIDRRYIKVHRMLSLSSHPAIVRCR